MPVDDELKEIETKYKTLKVLATRFLENDEWKNLLSGLLKYRVMRYPQIFQGLMFLTGWKREDLCLPKTNKLHWKWVREIQPDKIPKAMLAYSMYD